MRNGKEKERLKKMGVLEITSYKFQLQKVRFTRSYTSANMCLNTPLGIQGGGLVRWLSPLRYVFYHPHCYMYAVYLG